MQQVATKVFIIASVLFGLIGLTIVLTMPDNDDSASDFNRLLFRLLWATVFVILPSFALSIAGKYLNKRK